jgi:hypothetical protein
MAVMGTDAHNLDIGGRIHARLELEQSKYHRCVVDQLIDQIQVWLLLRQDAKALAAPARRTSWW